MFVCSGPGDGPAGGAAAVLARGDPGWGSGPALGEALVPRSADGCDHRALPVSLLQSVRYTAGTTRFLPLSSDGYLRAGRGLY